MLGDTRTFECRMSPNNLFLFRRFYTGIVNKLAA